jgi:hypothetical protein
MQKKAARRDARTLALSIHDDQNEKKKDAISAALSETRACAR